MGDVLSGQQPGSKRLQKMGDKTLSWISDLIEGMQDEEHGTPRSALFAPILPIDSEMQRWYLDALQDNFRESVSGLALFGLGSVESIPDSLKEMPRLYGGRIETPHRLLDVVEAGLDVIAVSFINEASESGLALHFRLQKTSEHHNGFSSSETASPLALDLWQPSFAADRSRLQHGCTCYTCVYHHRAYIQHLLNAKEMLAWVLLQIHNYHIMDHFFTAIRGSLQEGSFSECKSAFQRSYAPEFPPKSGIGPRCVSCVPKRDLKTTVADVRQDSWVSNQTRRFSKSKKASSFLE